MKKTKTTEKPLTIDQLIRGLKSGEIPKKLSSGRRPSQTAAGVKLIREAATLGASHRTIAASVGVSPWTVQRIITRKGCYAEKKRK